MRTKLVNSQMVNLATFEKYKRELLTLAQNVFNFKNLPTYIDNAYLNKSLLRKGAIAFFNDEVMGVIALPFTNMGKLDIYGRPEEIEVYAQNGYTRMLKRGEFVIMYDNNGRYPLYIDIVACAERIANIKRVIDINISQQKTPRVWKTTTGIEKSVQDMMNNYDGNVESVVGYDNLLTEDLQAVIAPAPFVADKLYESLEKEYAEFYSLIGISNVKFEKKERLITDEIKSSMGGTIASRYNRFNPREKAIKEINAKWDLNIEVEYYDGLPTSMDNESEVENNVDISDNENN